MVSLLHSRVPSCDIRVEPIPTKPLAVARAVRVGSTTVFVDTKDRIYCTGIQDGFSFTTAWANRRQFQDLYTGLVKLGVIPKADAATHLAEAAAIAKKIDDKQAAESLRRDATRVGLKLTADQARLLNALSPEKTNG